MKILKIIRSSEWWEYKLPPLLAIGYATSLNTPELFLTSLKQLLFLLISLIVGAAYVSIINDITDITVDLKSGKNNRMATIKPLLRGIIPFTCIIPGGICAYLLYPDWLSIFLYTMPWISFSLYSFPPFRLKDRGIAGVIADASGSHLFTSLLMISSISFIILQPIQWNWFLSTGLWALCYGFRGILWHQFYDRKNDLVANVNTFATRVLPEKFRKKELLIFLTELLALSSMLIYIAQPLVFIALIFYFILALLRTFKLKYIPVIILCPKNVPYQILMADFYQVFLPLSLLISLALVNSVAWIILVFHLLLFPQRSLNIIKDFFLLLKTKASV